MLYCHTINDTDVDIDFPERVQSALMILEHLEHSKIFLMSLSCVDSKKDPPDIKKIIT